MAMYLETMDRLKLDAYVYPPIQMPPPDETLPQNGEVSDGPHSDTGWTNMLGVPAVVVSGGFYPGGLPVGLEFSGRPWQRRRPAGLGLRLRTGDAPPPSTGAGGAGAAGEYAVISIRAMQPDNWAAVREMRLAALKASPGSFALSHDEVAAWSQDYWRAEIKGDDHQIFGLFDGNQLIGLTAAFTWRGDKTGKTALLAMSYIAPDYRGRGLSRKLYEARLNWIAEQPQFRKVIVGHRASNEVSRRANQRYGFAQTDRITNTWPDGAVEDEVIYELVLDRNPKAKSR